MEISEKQIFGTLVSVDALENYNTSETPKTYGYGVRALFREKGANTALSSGLAWLSEHTNSTLYGVFINFGTTAISTDDMVKAVNEHLKGVDVPLGVCEITLDKPKLLENNNVLRRHTYVCFNPEGSSVRVKALADMEKRIALLPDAE